MKIVGHSMNSSYSHQAKTCIPQSELIHEAGIACSGDVFVTQTFIEYGTEAECYRPKIVLAGRLLGLEGNFPDGINRISFEEADQPDVIMHYELTNNQIAKMYANGIFPDKDDLTEFIKRKEEGYTSYPETVVTPEIMNMNTYEGLPMTCSYLMVKDTDVPIIFVQPEQQYNIPLDETCGYELTDYLEPFKNEELQKDQFEQFESFVDEDELYQQEDTDTTEFTEDTVEQSVELTDEEKVAQNIFTVTKPRVDEHVDKDNAYLREVNEMVQDINMEEDENEYDSEFERMMREDMELDKGEEVATESEAEAVAESEDDGAMNDGPLNIKKVLERKKRQAQAVRNAAEQNEELNKTMPANLDDIQRNAGESDKQAGE